MEYYEDQLSNQGSRPKYDCLVFDLDDTLYPFSSGIADHISKNIQEYMIQKLGIEENKVVEMCYELYKKYGTTLAGLRAIGYDIDYDVFHRFVHGRLPYELLKPDPVLRNILHGLPIRKIVFTNSDMAHTSRALGRLGLEDCFDRIICFETLNATHGSNVSRENNNDNPSEIFNFMDNCDDPHVVLPKTPVVCKPHPEAFEAAFKIAEIDPKRTLFFDDSTRNLMTGSYLGLHTVLVGNPVKPDRIEYALQSIHNMKEMIPALSDDGEEKSEVMARPQEIAIETSVVA
ncbi:hypothetical protein Dimus_009160 [Dionaea muscipula]